MLPNFFFFVRYTHAANFSPPRVTGSDDHWTSMSKIMNETEKKVNGIVSLERHPLCKGHNCANLHLQHNFFFFF